MRSRDCVYREEIILKKLLQGMSVKNRLIKYAFRLLERK